LNSVIKQGLNGVKIGKSFHHSFVKNSMRYFAIKQYGAKVCQEALPIFSCASVLKIKKLEIFGQKFPLFPNLLNIS
jgi:hypothetical protein